MGGERDEEREVRQILPLLHGEERFQLHLEAVSRGDEAEVKRLVESCPCESYVMNEVGYAYRCMASKEIVEVLDRVLAPLLSKLEMMEGFRETLPYALKIYSNEVVFAYRDGYQAGSKRAWEAAGKTGDPPGWKERKVNEEDKDPEKQHLRSINKRLDEVSGAVVSPLEELERNLLEEALTIWTAFAHFCSEECGMEPEKLVKA